MATTTFSKASFGLKPNSLFCNNTCKHVTYISLPPSFLQSSSGPIRVSSSSGPIRVSSSSSSSSSSGPIRVSSSSSVTQVEERNNNVGSSLPFVFDDKDLVSNESVWNLYARWRKHFRVSYDNPNTLNNRFFIFKETLHFAYMDQHILHGSHNSTYTLDNFADTL